MNSAEYELNLDHIYLNTWSRSLTLRIFWFMQLKKERESASILYIYLDKRKPACMEEACSWGSSADIL